MTDTAQAATDVRYEQVDLRVGGVGLTVAAAGRDGDLAPVVFLHGFGSTKEDYLDIACQRAFTGHPFLAYDAPGCGETFCEDLPGISIPFLVKTAQALLDHAGIRRFPPGRAFDGRPDRVDAGTPGTRPCPELH